MSCFFIGGINRSGTTLLQSILCSDESTNPLIHEASYIRSILDAYIHGKNQFEEHNKYYFDDTEDLKKFTSNWAKKFLDKVRDRYPEATNLVLKHPPLTPNFPALSELLLCAGEDPYFLLLVRDPRDVIASLVKVGERLRQKGESEGNTLPRNMSLLSNYYMQCYMPALSSTNIEYKKRLLHLKYEDLVTRTDQVIEMIRDKSGLKLHEFDSEGNWKSNNIDINDLRNQKNAWVSNQWDKKISSDSVGSYRSILTKEEINVLENVCAGPLKSFGYT